MLAHTCVHVQYRGEVRSGGISETTLNYTGQKRDGTGLLYYHARYYDPTTARFLSADSIVPNTSHKSLTVDFHEPGFVAELNEENWSVLDTGLVRGYKVNNGTVNPQLLNRYSYVQNNPIRYVDPTGHHEADPNPPGHQNQLTYADELLKRPQSKKMSGKFPDEGPRNGAYYRTDKNGNVTGYAEYDSQGKIVRRTEYSDKDGWHSRYYKDNTGPDGVVRRQPDKSRDRHEEADPKHIPKGKYAPGTSQPRTTPKKGGGGVGGGGGGVPRGGVGGGGGGADELT